MFVVKLLGGTARYNVLGIQPDLVSRFQQRSIFTVADGAGSSDGVRYSNLGWDPELIKNGVKPVDTLIALLNENSARGSREIQSS